MDSLENFSPLQSPARRAEIHSRHRFLECSRSKTGKREVVPKKQVGVGEVDGELGTARIGVECPKDAVLGAKEVDGELDVSAPVATVVKG